MRMEQRQVTILNLRDGKPREFTVRRDSQGYHVRIASEGEVVQIALSAQDLTRLRQAVSLWQVVDAGTARAAGESDALVLDGAPQPGYACWGARPGLDWLAYN